MKLSSLLCILFFFSSCSHDSLAHLKDVETEQLSDFDHCAKNNSKELLSTDGTSGEIADFVMNSCDSQFHHYQDALVAYLLKRNPNPKNPTDYKAKAEKLAMDMWDKIRVKIVKFVDTKRDQSTSKSDSEASKVPVQ